MSAAGPTVERAYTAPGRTTLGLRADEPARLLLLGGPPFAEPIVMWWNFVGRAHDEIVSLRQEWQDKITPDGQVVADSQADDRGAVRRRHR